MTNQIYFIGTTLWLMVLADIANFEPFENMLDLAGNSLF